MLKAHLLRILLPALASAFVTLVSMEITVNLKRHLEAGCLDWTFLWV